jgi:hypothetical protein
MEVGIMLRIRVASCAALIAGALVLAGFSAAKGGRTSQAAHPASRITSSMRQLLRSGSLNSMVFGVWVNGRPLTTGSGD